MEGKQHTVDNERMPRRRRVRSRIFSAVDRVTGKVYSFVIHSLPGRIMTSYRTPEDREEKRGEAGKYRPLSRVKSRMVSVAESSRVVAFFRKLAHLLFVIPAQFYGFFGLFYSLFALIPHAAIPLLDRTAAVDWRMFAACLFITALSLPLVLTRRGLNEVLGRSRLGRLLFIHFLGVPKERFEHTEVRYKKLLPYVAVILAIPAAVATLRFHPFVIPVAILLLAVLGLICSYPEAGVVLSAVLLPFLWIWESVAYMMAALLLLCWVSYCMKLLLLHRTFKLGTLDKVVLIFAALVLVSGVTGAVINVDTVMQSVLLFVLISGYFLITNLMTTRAHVKRCLVGVVLSVALVTVLAWLRLIPVGTFGWLGGSPAGNYIIGTIDNLRVGLTPAWADVAYALPVLVMPVLLSKLPRSRRIFSAFAPVLLMALCMIPVLLSGSVSVWICVICEVLLFFLLYSHHTLTVGILATPVVALGAVWLPKLLGSDRIGLLDRVTTAGSLIVEGTGYRSLVWEGTWRMICDHPFGIGMSEACFTAVYPLYAVPEAAMATGSGSMYLDLLVCFGWSGLAVFGVVVFLFLQKNLSCARAAGDPNDRTVLLGGVTCMVGVLILGIVRGIGTEPAVFFSFWVLVALCNAYANIVFDENRERRIRTESEGRSEDRWYRLGL